jgi:hypothetical protein
MRNEWNQRCAHPHLPSERRERMALGNKAGKPNRAMARELHVDEKMIRLDRQALAKAGEERSAMVPRLKVPKRGASLVPVKIRERHVQALLKIAKHWIAEERLQLIDIEYAVHQAGLHLYEGRNLVERLPQSGKSPEELLVLTKPREPDEDYMPAQLEFWTNCLARWLACSAAGDEDLQDEVLRQISIWARS